MALTELQLPTKETFYSNLQAEATNIKDAMNRLRDMADFLVNVDTADLTAMDVPDIGDIRQDMVDFRIAINDLVNFFNGTSLTQTKVPEAVIDMIRRMR